MDPLHIEFSKYFDKHLTGTIQTIQENHKLIEDAVKDINGNFGHMFEESAKKIRDELDRVETQDEKTTLNVEELNNLLGKELENILKDSTFEKNIELIIAHKFLVKRLENIESKFGDYTTLHKKMIGLENSFDSQSFLLAKCQLCEIGCGIVWAIKLGKVRQFQIRLPTEFARDFSKIQNGTLLPISTNSHKQINDVRRLMAMITLITLFYEGLLNLSQSGTMYVIYFIVHSPC